MQNNYSFYLEKNNKLFMNDVLTICYKASSEEVKSYGLTSDNILIIVSHPKISKLAGDKISYLKEIKKIFHNENIFLRIQSECLLGVYGDSHCDCEEQRIKAIKLISENNGIYIHLPQEAQGLGLYYKLKELELQVSGRDIDGNYIGEKNRDDAQKYLLNNSEFNDVRSYIIVHKILEQLNLSNEQFVLISDSQNKLNELKEAGLKLYKYSEYKDKIIDSDNSSEYLVKILNSTHDFDEKTIDKIIELIDNRDYNGRTLSNLIKLVQKIKKDKDFSLNKKYKEKFLNVYENIICGIEKKYIMETNNSVNIKNAFSCKVNSSVFKAIKNLYGEKVFDRISLEKLYYFNSLYDDNNIRIRSSKVLENCGGNCCFLKGQIHVEQRIFSDNNRQIVQNEISMSKLRSFFENTNYEFSKRVEMITTISEGQIQGINIYIKKLPNIENRIMDIYGKKEDIKKFINNITDNFNRSVFSDLISNKDYEDENFANCNLRFSDLAAALEEELYLYNLLIKGE